MAIYIHFHKHDGWNISYRTESIVLSDFEWYVSRQKEDDLRYEDIFEYSDWDEITSIFQNAIKQNNISKAKVLEIIEGLY